MDYNAPPDDPFWLKALLWFFILFAAFAFVASLFRFIHLILSSAGLT